VHQARVALRRLLSVLREFGDWSPQVDAQWSPRLHALFAELGLTRDRDVLGGWIFDELQAAGAPAVDPGATMDAPDLASCWRSHEVTGLMLELLAFAYGEASAAPQAATPSPGSTLDRARPALRRLHRRVRRAGRQFAEIDDVARHRARKQLKRLRYGAESLSSLFPAADWARYLTRLKRAQDALGRFQDLTLAEAAYRSRVAEDPRAWFALGWIAARRSACIDEAGRALIALDRAPKFLR
jgi:CHAD domain-containing protein